MIPVPFDHTGKPKPEYVWLDKKTQYQLIDLERKYSDIPWVPLDIPSLVPDDLEKFVRFFQEHAIDGIRTISSFDEPHVDPYDSSSSYNNPYWKTLEIYKSESAKDWFGTDTIKNLTIDIKELFPKFYQQIFDTLPYKEIFFIRFWSTCRTVGPHRDQDWTYNVPLSFRSVIFDTNTDSTFYLSKKKTNDIQARHYVKLPSETNSFLFNNGAFYHGADYYDDHFKILMVASGIPDIEKFEKILKSSTEKYNPSRSINIESRYLVYNITFKKEKIDNPHSWQDVFDLYKLLLGSPEVVNVEEHHSWDQLRSELRVIFWNQEEYFKFSKRTHDEYNKIIQRLNNNYLNLPVEFFRYTSNDNYQSEFPETVYPDGNQLINWTLIPLLKKWVVDNIMPLGKVQQYLGHGKFSDTSITGCRFFYERTGNIERLDPSKKSMNDFPDLITYDFEHSLQFAIGKQPYIYNRFTALSRKVEEFAENYITDCEHSAVLVGHNSLGKEINVHTHRFSDIKKFTMTIIVRLTFNDEPVRYAFYQPIADDDPLLDQYYTKPNLLQKYIKNKSPEIIQTKERSSVLIFNAAYTPHSVEYSNDLYLYFVYDNVTFKPGVLEDIENTSKTVLFGNQPQTDRLYFYDL
jgi:hypothetical protein